jgi:hypothetical protein
LALPDDEPFLNDSADGLLPHRIANRFASGTEQTVPDRMTAPLRAAAGRPRLTGAEATSLQDLQLAQSMLDGEDRPTYRSRRRGGFGTFVVLALLVGAVALGAGVWRAESRPQLAPTTEPVRAAEPDPPPDPTHPAAAPTETAQPVVHAQAETDGEGSSATPPPSEPTAMEDPTPGAPPEPAAAPTPESASAPAPGRTPPSAPPPPLKWRRGDDIPAIIEAPADPGGPATPPAATSPRGDEDVPLAQPPSPPPAAPESTTPEIQRPAQAPPPADPADPLP